MWKDIAWNGVWKQNTGLVQILGLCPILAISNSFVNAVSLGLATILVMALSNVVISALRNLIPYEIRIPVFILIIAALVTVVDLAFNAWLHSLYLVLGIFIPLIVTNCIVLARVEAFAAKNAPLESTLDGIAMGVGLLLVLAILGGMREIIGTGQAARRHRHDLPGAQAAAGTAGRLPGLSRRHPAARCLHLSRPADRREELARSPCGRPASRTGRPLRRTDPGNRFDRPAARRAARDAEFGDGKAASAIGARDKA